MNWYRFAQANLAYVCVDGILPVGTPLVSGSKNKARAGWQDVELVFEEVRQQLAPQAPSRLECVFVSPTPEDAEMWCGGTGSLYEVQLQGRTFEADSETYSAAVFRGANYEPIRDPNVKVDHDVVRRIAEGYWTQGGGMRPEILADGAVVVRAIREQKSVWDKEPQKEKISVPTNIAAWNGMDSRNAQTSPSWLISRNRGRYSD